MSRIKGNNIKLGNSYVVGQEQDYDSVDFNYDNQDFLSTVTPELRKKIESVITSAQEEAAKIKTQAEVQAQNLIQQTQEKAFQEGYQDGIVKGRAEGMQAIQNELNAKLSTFEKFLSTNFNIKKQVIKSCESEIIQLSVIIAEKIIKKKLNENSEFLTSLASAAIKQLKNKDSVKISVNPAFIEQVYSITPEIKQQIIGLDNLKIVEDSTIPPEGLIVESTDVRIDASYMAQLDIIINNLLNSINHEDSSVAEEFAKKENQKNDKS